MKKFNYDVMIHIADTDATGVIFFPKLFEKCLTVLECFLTKNNLGGALVHEGTTFPVVHAQAHYYAPISLYENLTVELSISRIGKTSVSFIYKFINKAGLLSAEASIVHVCVDGHARIKKDLPQKWLDLFHTLLQK